MLAGAGNVCIFLGMETLTPQQQDKINQWEAAGFSFTDCTTFDQCADKFVAWFN